MGLAEYVRKGHEVLSQAASYVRKGAGNFRENVDELLEEYFPRSASKADHLNRVEAYTGLENALGRCPTDEEVTAHLRTNPGRHRDQFSY